MCSIGTNVTNSHCIYIDTVISTYSTFPTFFQFLREAQFLKVIYGSLRSAQPAVLSSSCPIIAIVKSYVTLQSQIRDLKIAVLNLNLLNLVPLDSSFIST